MKKSDLKNGMWVETQNGNKYIVLLNTPADTSNYLLGQAGWMSLDDYDDDLNCISKGCPHLTIIKVYSPTWTLNSPHIILWERKKVKEMTLSQAIKELGRELGCEIKIIEEKTK